MTTEINIVLECSETVMTKAQEHWNESDVSKYSKIGQVELAVLHPLFHESLGDITGKSVVDYGCGEGKLLEELAERGAKVYGYDISPAMIGTAQRILGDKAQLSVIKSGIVPLQNNTVEVVVSNLVFMMISSEEELKLVFQEVNRVLTEGGNFAFSITHPAFAETKFTTYYNRFHEPPDYFKSGQPYQFVLLTANGTEITNEHFRDYHYPLETYFNLICDSGFALRQVREVKVEGNGYPPYLFLKADKLKSICLAS